MSRPVPFPARHLGLALHARLAHDPAASADLCEAFVGPLAAWLRCRFPWVDPHLCESAAHDALIDHLNHPGRFDPARADLAAYLRLAAKRDLLNAVRAEQRHQRDRVPLEAVELGGPDGNSFQGEPGPLEGVCDAEEAARMRDDLAHLRGRLSGGEASVFDLLVAGERATATFAAALGLSDQPAAEQARAVKRAKDRLLKRLQRGGRHDEPA